MGIHYTFYNPNNGAMIEGAKYCGMPFFNGKDYGRLNCAIQFDYSKGVGLDTPIKKWTINKEDHLYKKYFGEWCDDWTEYITRECAIEMQKDMEKNNTLFTDIMDRAGCDALIMDVSY